MPPSHRRRNHHAPLDSRRNNARIRLDAWIDAWVTVIQSAPALIIATAMLLVGGAVAYTVTNIGVYTDTVAMLAEDLPFRRSYEQYRRTFPSLVDTLIVVVDAPTPEYADAAAGALAADLAAAPESFVDVFFAGADPFLTRAALLYLDAASLDALTATLQAAAPLFGNLERGPDLAAFASVIGAVLTGDATGIDRQRLTTELDRTLSAELDGRPDSLSWQRLLMPGSGDAPGDDSARRFVFAKPVLDFSAPLAAEAAIARIRRATPALTERYAARIRITGDAALSHEELTTALDGARWTGALALVMVAGVLLIGLGSAWLALAAVINLLAGLCLTAAFAALAVGQLNLISLAFAVLYIGLGVDYAIHLTLRYRERLRAGEPRAVAVRHATVRMAGPLLLCTLTTATAFYAFVPTSFAGVAELGLISGTGMFINLALSLTLLPAALTLLPTPRIGTGPARRRPDDHQAQRQATRRRNILRTITPALAIVAVAGLPGVAFDFDALNLRPADAESVATLRDLMADDATPPFHISVLAPDADAARALQLELRALPTVSDAQTIEDILPVDSERKRDALHRAAAALGTAAPKASTRDEANPDAARSALRALGTRLVDAGAPFAELHAHLDQFMRAVDAAPAAERTARISRLESRWLDQLAPALLRLSGALSPPPVSIDTLPAGLRNRWIGTDGSWRIAVYPRDDLDDREALRRFVRTVQTVAPEATDEPVLNVEAGDAIVGAFRGAFALSVLIIALLLAAIVRRVQSVALILLPLLLAGLLTMGIMGFAGIPFNFANVIALPLLFGIGVDNGVHMVQRAREGDGRTNPMRTSTSRGVLFAMLTTICGFGGLLVSPHPGTASIGLVLTLGIVITAFCTLIVLPAWLPTAVDPPGDSTDKAS